MKRSRHVKAHKGAAEIDGQSLNAFEANWSGAVVPVSELKEKALPRFNGIVSELTLPKPDGWRSILVCLCHSRSSVDLCLVLLFIGRTPVCNPLYLL